MGREIMDNDKDLIKIVMEPAHSGLDRWVEFRRDYGSQGVEKAIEQRLDERLWLRHNEELAELEGLRNEYFMLAGHGDGHASVQLSRVVADLDSIIDKRKEARDESNGT